MRSPTAARLVAIGGLAGSGKSALAAALASAIGSAPGAVVLRSDVIRKRLMGVTAALGAEGYAPEVTARVYAALREETAMALAAGQSVIADAVHAAPAERADIAAVAEGLGLGVNGLWLEAPRTVAAARLAARRGDASDASAAVLDQQLDYDLGEMTWQRIDADGPLESVRAAAADVLGLGATPPDR